MSWALTAGCAVALAVVLATSAVGKFRDVDGFATSLPGSVPFLAGRRRSWRPVALAVCAGEALLASVLVVAVLTGSAWTAAFGLTAALALFVAFTAVVASLLRREVRRPCHCFGTQADPASRVDLVRNGVLVLVALVGAVAGAFAAFSGGTVPAGAVWVATGAGVALALVLIDLVALGWLLEPVRPYGA